MAGFGDGVMALTIAITLLAFENGLAEPLRALRESVEQLAEAAGADEGGRKAAQPWGLPVRWASVLLARGFGGAARVKPWRRSSAPAWSRALRLCDAEHRFPN